MDTNDTIKDQKKSILKKIAGIESMRKGSISEQMIKTSRKDGTIKENGPYYILTSKDPSGKTVTESFPKEKLAFYRQEIENYKEFKELTNKYELLSEESSKIKSGSDELMAEKLKKNKGSK